MTSSAATPTPSLSSADCARLLPLVRRIAVRLSRRLPRHIELEELLAHGWLGLVQSMSRAPAGMSSEETEAFLSRRVRGAMLDYLRSNSPTGRELRNSDRRAARAGRDFTRREGRSPDANEVAALAARPSVAPGAFEIVDFDSVIVASDATHPDELAGRAIECERIRAAIAHLPERKQQMLSLHYVDELTLKEIGAVFGVTESRVSQILTQSLAELRTEIGAVAA